MDIMITSMREYCLKADHMLQVYSEDSLAQEYRFYQQEYMRLDSCCRMDSLMKKSKAILVLKLKQKNEVAVHLMNWEQIAQYRIEQKRLFLSKLFYEKVTAAYKKIVSARKYDLVLKPNTFEAFTPVENVFVYVAKELTITLPKELTF